MNKLLNILLLNKFSKSAGGTTPTGTINITENGTVDVTDYAEANVNVVSEYNAKIYTDSISSLSASYPNIKNLIVEAPTINLGNKTSCQGFFSGCYYLEKVELFDTKDVTNMSSMFQNCYAIKNIPLFNTSKVTNMQTMFQGCENLENIPILDTHLVSPYNMSNMYSGCPKLTDETLNNILYMCANCGSGTANRTLQYIGLTSDQATKCETLSNWDDFYAAGWRKGY